MLIDPNDNKTTWHYDGFGRLASEVATGSNPVSGAPISFGTRSYVYDANGNVIRATDRDGRVTTYAYDGLNEKIQEQWLNGSTVLRTLSYAYDAAGNLTSTSDPSASYTYAYDSLNRPTSVTTTLPGLAPSVTLVSQYDNSGNRKQLSATGTSRPLFFARRYADPLGGESHFSTATLTLLGTGLLAIGGHRFLRRRQKRWAP
jgi:YD repeat-containing protein